MSTSKIASLELEVKSSSQSASSGLDALASSLEKVRNATKGGLGLSACAKQLGSLNTALSGFNSTSIANIKGVGDAIKSLSGVKVSSSISNQIAKINTALSSFNIGDGATKITELVAALKPLETLGKSNLGTTVNALKKLPEALQNLDTRQLYTQIQSLTRIMQPLADEMQKIANGFSVFPDRIQRLITANERLRTSNNGVGTSYVNLLAKLKMAYNGIKVAAKMIGSFISKINDYIENVNLFNVSMGEFAKEAGEYAEQVGEAMGIDPGEWMRNQGVFMTLATGFGVVSDRAYIMSKNLTQLGYDIASFFNIPVADAMQKLQSGLAGELEPLRRIGYDLSQARLQLEAYTLGIDKKVAKMTQAEKAELRYHAIMTQVTASHGDMARTLSAPANQLRVLSAQFTMAARAIGSIFIPALNAVLPYIIAVTKVIRELASAVANAFGFEMPEVDYSGVDMSLGGAADSADALSSGLGDAAKKAKKLKQYTMGFDELNVIDPTKGDSDSGSDSGIGSGAGFDFKLPEYDFLGDLVASKIDGIVAGLRATIEDVFFEWGSELNSENILEKIVVGLSAITGGYIGWKLGGVKGAIIGATLGMALGLVMDAVVFDHNGSVSFNEFFDLLRDILIVGAGGAVGFAFGGFKGEAIGITVGFSLMLLLEALEMKSDKSIAHTVENILMSLVPVGLGIGFGKKVGSEFLDGLCFSFEAGEGVLKSFNDGISSVSASLTGFQRGLVGVVGGVTEFLGVFTGVKNIAFDVANNSSSLGSIFLSMIPIVAGLTAGFIAFSIAFNSTGIGLIVTLCVGAVAALIGLTEGIAEAGRVAYEKTTDFMMMEDIISRASATADNCATAMDNMKSGIESIDKVSSDFAMAGTLVNEIMSINENANASAYELAEMQTKVDILNGLGIEGLSLSIDETTGRVVESREAVEKLIESLEQEARMEAMRDLLVQSYKDQYQAMADAEKALNDYNVANEALQKTSDELSKCSWFDFKKRAELKAAQEKETEALKAANEAYETAQKTIGDLESTIETYSTELTNMKLNEAGVGDELVKGVENIETALVETTGQMPTLGKDLADGLKNGVTDNVKKEDYVSVWGKIGNWFKNLFGIHSPSTVFAEYGKNITDGLFGKISSTYTSGKAIIEKWSTKVKEWFTGGSGSGNIFNNFATYASDIITNFKTKIGNKYNDVKENMTTWADKTREWFTGGNGTDNIFNNFTTYASDIISNFKTKIGDKYTDVKDNMTTWATKTKEWFTGGSGSGNIFDNFKSYASDIVTNFKNKIGEKYTDVKGNITKWSTKVKEWFTKEDNGETIFDKFTSFGSTIVTNLSAAIDGGVVESNYENIFGRISTALTNVKRNLVGIINSIIGFVEKMTNGIINGINGMIKGLNKLSIKVPDGVPGIGGTNFGFDIPLLNTITLPRVELKADGGFVDTGQMFIARESGAELVGNIGRRTAVVNNEQIVASVSRGVAEANNESNALLREQNTLLRAMLEKESGVYLDGKSITKSVEKHQRERGRVLVTGGAY